MMNDFARILIFSALSCLLYCLLFGRRTSYRSRRVYLLSTAVAAALIPAVDIRIGNTALYALTGWMADTVGAGRGIEILYLAGVLLSASVYGYRLAVLLRDIRRNTVARYVRDGRTVVETALPCSFSLLDKVYISKNLSGTGKDMVISHEASHLRHGHTWEKLLMQVLKTVMWFNPFVHLAAVKLDEVHEYEADRDVLRAGYGRKVYAVTILGNVMNAQSGKEGYVIGLPYCPSAFHRTLTGERLKQMLRPAGNRKNIAAFLLALLCFAFTAVEFTWEERKTSPPKVDFAELRCMQDSSARNGAAMLMLR